MTRSIAVLVPIYQHENYVGATVRSVLEQRDVELRLICVDDGSADASLRKAREAAGDDARASFHQHPGGLNKGLSATLRLALSLARESVVTVCASDDVLLPGSLAARVAALHRREWCYGRARLVDKAGRPTGEFWGDAPVVRQFEQILVRNPVPAPTLAADRELLLDVGAWSDSMLFEDLALVLRLAAVQTGQFINAPLADYRRLETGQDSQARFDGRSLTGALEAVQNVAGWRGLPTALLPVTQHYLQAWQAAIGLASGEWPADLGSLDNELARLIAAHWHDLGGLESLRTSGRRLLASRTGRTICVERTKDRLRSGLRRRHGRTAN